MQILLDACVIMAVLIEEPEKDLILKLTKGAVIVVPNITDFEIGNALSKLYKRKIITKQDVSEAFLTYKKIPLQIEKVDINNSIKIFCKYSIYAYDAYYLELAFRLNLPLLTFDANMKTIAKDLKIKIMEM